MPEKAPGEPLRTAGDDLSKIAVEDDRQDCRREGRVGEIVEGPADDWAGEAHGELNFYCRRWLMNPNQVRGIKRQ